MTMNANRWKFAATEFGRKDLNACAYAVAGDFQFGWCTVVDSQSINWSMPMRLEKEKKNRYYAIYAKENRSEIEIIWNEMRYDAMWLWWSSRISCLIDMTLMSVPNVPNIASLFIMACIRLGINCVRVFVPIFHLYMVRCVFGHRSFYLIPFDLFYLICSTWATSNESAFRKSLGQQCNVKKRTKKKSERPIYLAWFLSKKNSMHIDYFRQSIQPM